MVKEYLGDSKYDLYVKRKKLINDLFYTGNNIAGEDIFNKILETHGKMAKSLVKWQSHNFPKLDIYISSIRLLTFGKLPKVYHDAIKEYVLYGTKNTTPVLFRRQQPVITIEKDKKTIDPYINIKIYVDTDISTKSIFSTKLLDYIRGLQTELPNYFKPLTVPQASSFIRTWLYLYLTESKGLSSIKANDILENQYHLTPVEQAHLTQTVKTRFKDIFKQ
jgi:hypothetical protein